jgi:hypothetical protein
VHAHLEQVFLGGEAEGGVLDLVLEAQDAPVELLGVRSDRDQRPLDPRD